MGYQPKTLKERKTPEVFKEKKALQNIHGLTAVLD
jgi:hypothetical protein